MEKMLTSREVSNILGYTRDTQCRFVSRLRKEGHLKGVKIGNKLLFKESDVEEFIEHQYEIQNKEIKNVKKETNSMIRSKYDENILSKENCTGNRIEVSKEKIKE